ncbi:hypothetical protein D3C79_928920 [compost metagenome]
MQALEQVVQGLPLRVRQGVGQVCVQYVWPAIGPGCRFCLLEPGRQPRVFQALLGYVGKRVVVEDMAQFGIAGACLPGEFGVLQVGRIGQLVHTQIDGAQIQRLLVHQLG